jgi:acyl-CoA thioesterase FadM
MATAKATLVCIALAERKAVPVPPEFRERIAEFDGATTA